MLCIKMTAMRHKRGVGNRRNVSYTHKQKEQRNDRKGKRRLHPVGAQTETQDRKMVLSHGGAPLVAESEGFRLPECTGWWLAHVMMMLRENKGCDDVY